MGWLEVAKVGGLGLIAIGIVWGFIYIIRKFAEGEMAKKDNKDLLRDNRGMTLDLKKYVEVTGKESRRHEKAVQDIFRRVGPFGTKRVRELLNESPKDPG